MNQITDALDLIFPPADRPLRFDLDGAMAQFADAAFAWTTVAMLPMFLGGVVDENRYNEAQTRFQCAGAILAWELARTTTLGIIPAAPWLPDAATGADYDDDTVNALLLGSR